MSAKNKAGKIIGIVLLIVAIVFVLAVFVFYLPLKKYMDATPKITPKSQVTVQVGDTVEWQDLFDVECKGDYTVKMSIDADDYPTIQMSEDGQSFVANGTVEGVVIYMYARGSNAESVDATNTITIE